jgi:hypothetical protein
MKIYTNREKRKEKRKKRPEAGQLGQDERWPAAGH